MSHTEEFNRIMGYTNSAYKEKKTAKREQKKIVAVLIGERPNMNELQESLAKCRIAGNTVYLPLISEGMLHNYQDVRKALLNAGSTYNKNSFVFPSDAAPYIERLMGGESVNIKKEFQFFPTPSGLADRIVEIADVKQWDKILEPSAGQGAIIEAIFRECEYLNHPVDYCEIMDANRSILEKKIDRGLRAICVAQDFLLLESEYKWNKIIANPPFNKNQDIDHIRKMFSLLEEGGRIVAIAGNSWRFGSQKKQVEFRNWLDELGAVVEDVEAGAFQESGTQIATCIITIDK